MANQQVRWRLAFSIACLVAASAAQKPHKPPPKEPASKPALKPGERPPPAAPDAGPVDPFTKNDALAMLKAGYYSFGPFELGDGHDTKKVAEVLGDLGIAWVETSHFKIGCSVSPLPAPSGKEGADLERELAELKTVLPTVDPKAKMLSTWLRTHLLARRAEATYDEVRRRLGAHDEEFPPEGAGPDFKNYRGQGPYFGHRGKFLVLVFDRASSFARYARAFVDTKQRFTIRHLFHGTDSMLFMTAEEFSDSRFRDDRALHCHFVFGLVHNLLDAYRHFNHELPVWFTEGLALWYVRKLDPRYASWSTTTEFGTDWRTSTNWEQLVRGLVQTKSVPPATSTMQWFDFEPAKFSDRMVFWSRIDWLLTFGDEKLKVFVDTMKEPFDRLRKKPTRIELLARQDEALKKAWGLDLDSFDQFWAAWVLKTYVDK